MQAWVAETGDVSLELCRTKAPMRRISVWMAMTVVAGVIFTTANAQLSDPIAHDDNMDVSGNKFLTRSASDDGSERADDGMCVHY